MLLAQYLAAKGHLPAGALAANSFAAIRAFLFGEEYTVELTLDADVHSYRFDTLDDALAVLASEFASDDRFLPEIQIVSYSKTRDRKFGQLAQVVGNEKTGYSPPALRDPVKDALRFGFAAMPQVPTFGPAADRVLAVTRSERNLAFPAPEMEYYTEDIKQAVTYYSLTGNWDQFEGRSNL